MVHPGSDYSEKTRHKRVAMYKPAGFESVFLEM